MTDPRFTGSLPRAAELTPSVDFVVHDTGLARRAAAAEVLAALGLPDLAARVAALEAREQPTTTIGPFFATDLVTTGTTGQQNSTLKMPRAGRVVGLYMVSDATCTAGTATAGTLINGLPVAFNGGSVAINATTDTTSDSGLVPYASGVPFAAGDRLGVEVVTADFAPAGGNVNLWVEVAFAPF